MFVSLIWLPWAIEDTHAANAKVFPVVTKPPLVP